MLHIKSGHTWGYTFGTGLYNNPLIGYENLITSIEAPDDGTNIALNLLNESTAEKWVSSASNPTYILFDTSDAIDYVALVNHNFHLHGGTVDLEYSDNGGSSWTALFSSASVPSRAPLVFFFPQQSHDLWRVLLTGPFDQTPFASVIQAGNMLSIPRNIYVGHTPINYGRTTKTTGGMSETGEFLGRKVLSQSLQTQMDFNSLDAAWYRSTFFPFQQHAETKPFIWIWRPSSFEEETAFCWCTRDIDMSNSTDGIDISMRITGHNSVWQ